MNKAPASPTLCSSSPRQSKPVARHQAENCALQNNDIAVEVGGLFCNPIPYIKEKTIFLDAYARSGGLNRGEQPHHCL
jgi:hypothetical protein